MSIAAVALRCSIARSRHSIHNPHLRPVCPPTQLHPNAVPPTVFLPRARHAQLAHALPAAPHGAAAADEPEHRRHAQLQPKRVRATRQHRHWRLQGGGAVARLHPLQVAQVDEAQVDGAAAAEGQA